MSLTLYYLHNKSTKVQTNTPEQPERLNSFAVSEEDKKWMDEEWRKDKEKLKYKLVSSDTYLSIKQKGWFNRGKPFLSYGLFLVMLVVLVFLFPDTKNIERYYVALFSVVVGYVAADIQNWR